jgi:hypothetical protein
MDLRYEDLLNRRDGPPGSSWGLFGKQRQIGTLSFMTSESVLAGLQCVKRGQVFNLDYPVSAFDPPLSPTRRTAVQTIFQNNADQRDDYFDSFYPQISSQIDGLRHRRHPTYGFYDGVPDDAVGVGTPDLGIQLWAERGIVGRAVLVDLERFVRVTEGRSVDHRRGEALDIELVQRALDRQGCSVTCGDIVLLHTGWAHCYFSELASNRSGSQLRSSGLLQARSTLAWLWDNGIAMIAADNVAVEAIPAAPSSPFSSPTEPGLMHQELIALLGFALGELWNLHELAEDCARDGVYEMLLCAKPLNMIGGVGSTANALAIK